MIDGVETDPRAALEVTRYHTWRRTRDQSTGEHSAQVMRILLTVWPDCPRKLLVHCLMHDLGEMTGDIPYPGKLRNPDLKAAKDRLENENVAQQCESWFMRPPSALSDYEKHVFKTCEYIEMWEYGLQEQNTGNKYGQIIAHRCIIQASAHVERLPGASAAGPDLRPAFKRYVARRTEHELGMTTVTREKISGS